MLPDLGEEPLGGDSIANGKFTAAKKASFRTFVSFASKIYRPTSSVAIDDHHFSRSLGQNRPNPGQK